MKEDFQNIKYRIREEGFHYCFVHYSKWLEIQDEKFHQLREDYLQIAKKLEEYVLEKAELEKEDDEW
jgi:predicted metal-binding transcription factor (methanogenesis marker protein 9)